MPDVTVIPDGAPGKHWSIRTSAPETGSGHLTRRANGAVVGLPGRWRNAARGPEPAGPSGLGRIFPECGVALLDRRMTAALRSAPCLEKMRTPTQACEWRCGARGVRPVVYRTDAARALPIMLIRPENHTTVTRLRRVRSPLPTAFPPPPHTRRRQRHTPWF